MKLCVRRLASTMAAALLGIAILLGYLGYLQLSGNFHTVVQQAFYRSGQPTTDMLRRYHDDFGIRSVINLRGERPGKTWYDEEVATAEALGISHFDFRMASSDTLSKDRAVELVELMRAAPKPLLIHCKAGADRTGLAAALYLAAIAGSGESRAEEAISLRYGHFSVPYLSAAYPMDESWEDFEPWLGFEDS